MSARSPARRLALLCVFSLAVSGCQMLSHQDDDVGGLTELAPAGGTATPRQTMPPPVPEEHGDVVNNPAHEDVAPPPPAPPPPPSDMPRPRPARTVNTVAAAEPPVATPPQARLHHSEPAPAAEATVHAAAEPEVAAPPQPRRHHPVPVPLGDSTVEANPVAVAESAPASPPADAAEPPATAAPEEQVVHFESASAVISDEDSDVLARHVVYLLAHPKLKVRLEGYTDVRGSEKYNKALGERRARAVRAFLIQAGVKPAQLAAVSFGRQKPVDAGNDEEAWARNRRVVLVYTRR